MYRQFRLPLALVAVAFLFGCVGQAHAQRVGGYSEISAEDSVAFQAAGFALLQKEGGEVSMMLIAVERAERQVVAGMNYKLCLRVRVNNAAEEIETVKLITAVVYRNLQGEFSLTSWEEAECVPAGGESGEE